MKYLPTSEFLEWAGQHGIGRHPEHPAILAYVNTDAPNRLWEMSCEPEGLLALLLTALDHLPPWTGCWALRREGPWSFEAQSNGEACDAESAAQDVTARWLGIPTGFDGAILFGADDRARLIALLLVGGTVGWSTSHDLFLVPDHGRQLLWLDHEGVLWVFFVDSQDIEPYVESLARAGFRLPLGPPDGIARQKWMNSG